MQKFYEKQKKPEHIDHYIEVLQKLVTFYEDDVGKYFDISSKLAQLQLENKNLDSSITTLQQQVNSILVLIISCLLHGANGTCNQYNMYFILGWKVSRGSGEVEGLFGQYHKGVNLATIAHWWSKPHSSGCSPESSQWQSDPDKYGQHKAFDKASVQAKEHIWPGGHSCEDD